MRIVQPSVLLVQYTPDWERAIWNAGTLCYQSERRDVAPSRATMLDFIHRLITKGHESVIEHVNFTFQAVCDRGVSHELVRHRLASYSQESTRYCNYSKERFGTEITVIKPPGLGSESQLEWELGVLTAERAYLKMLETGCTPQIARSVLPTCLKTEIVFTFNARELRHFLRLRLAKAAHPQMREIARLVYDLVLTQAGALVLLDDLHALRFEE